MAIQFHCPGCKQPIEVDDEFAGQTAACPYCSRVVTVPQSSTLELRPTVTARPAGREAPAAPESGDAAASATPPADESAAPRRPYVPPPPRVPPPYSPPPPPPAGDLGLHVGAPPDEATRAARAYGNYSLICSALIVVLGIGMLIVLTPIAIAEMKGNLASQPSPEQMAEALMRSGKLGIVLGLRVGLLLFSLVGLVVGVVSVTRRVPGNWRGWVGTLVTGLAMLCTCVDILTGIALS